MSVVWILTYPRHSNRFVGRHRKNQQRFASYRVLKPFWCRTNSVMFTGEFWGLRISSDSNTVGFSYQRIGEEASKDRPLNTEKEKRKDALRLQDDTLVLGHVSLLTTFVLSRDEKYIMTADRDEHIRVSWFPQAYTIERFCLGHKKYGTVSSWSL